MCVYLHSVIYCLIILLLYIGKRWLFCGIERQSLSCGPAEVLHSQPSVTCMESLSLPFGKSREEDVTVVPILETKETGSGWCHPFRVLTGQKFEGVGQDHTFSFLTGSCLHFDFLKHLTLKLRSEMTFVSVMSPFLFTSFNLQTFKCDPMAHSF